MTLPHGRSPTRSHRASAPPACSAVNGGADISGCMQGTHREGTAAPCAAWHTGAAQRTEARDGFMQASRSAVDKASDRAAAGRRVRHHRLLHQAPCVLPPYPAGRRGAVRPDE
jgi:hypothetical protein